MFQFWVKIVLYRLEHVGIGVIETIGAAPVADDLWPFLKLLMLQLSGKMVDCMRCGIIAITANQIVTIINS